MTARSSGRFAIADELQGQYPEFKEYIENVARLRLEKICGGGGKEKKKKDLGNSAKQRLMRCANNKCSRMSRADRDIQTQQDTSEHGPEQARPPPRRTSLFMAMKPKRPSLGGNGAATTELTRMAGGGAGEDGDSSGSSAPVCVEHKGKVKVTSLAVQVPRAAEAVPMQVTV